MNGCVIPGTPIAVDFWKVRECPQAKIFFLTHLHGDHVVGLTSSWQQKIYCSENTARLAMQILGVQSELIHTLYPGNSNVIYLDENQEQQMTVIMFDANHCPGSAMFLFEGYFGKFLYTGDFRFHENILSQLSVFGCVNSLDGLYLDNTYCTPQSIFPPREETLEEIVKVIQKHPCHDVIIGLRNLGKEDILLKIASELDEYISVPSSLLRNAQVLKLPDVFQRTDVPCRIRVVPFNCVSTKNVNKWNQTKPTVVILPTALYIGLDFSPFVNVENVYVIPYSDHSSYSELLKFVGFLKPKSVIPIVSAKTRGPFGISMEDRADMKCFARLLSNDSQIQQFSIPRSVQKFMYTCAIPCTRKFSEKRRLKSIQKVRARLKVKNIVKGVKFTDDPSLPAELDKTLIATCDNVGRFIFTSSKVQMGICTESTCVDSTAVLERLHDLQEHGSRKCSHFKNSQQCLSSLESSSNNDSNTSICLHDITDVPNFTSTSHDFSECNMENSVCKSKMLAKAELSIETLQDHDIRMSHDNTRMHDVGFMENNAPELNLKSSPEPSYPFLHVNKPKQSINIGVIPLQHRLQRRERACRALLNKIVYT